MRDLGSRLGCFRYALSERPESRSLSGCESGTTYAAGPSKIKQNPEIDTGASRGTV